MCGCVGGGLRTFPEGNRAGTTLGTNLIGWLLEVAMGVPGWSSSSFIDVVAVDLDVVMVVQSGVTVLSDDSSCARCYVLTMKWIILKWIW